MKWAAASSGMTLIARTTFSNVASQAFDNVFSSSYRSYLVIIENIIAATNTDDLQLQFRYGSTTLSTGTYYTSSLKNSYNATGFANNDSQTAGTWAQLANLTYNLGGYLYFYRVGNSNQTPHYNGYLSSVEEASGYLVEGISNSGSNTYTGFLLKSSSTNITGTVATYGLAI